MSRRARRSSLTLPPTYFFRRTRLAPYPYIRVEECHVMGKRSRFGSRYARLARNIYSAAMTARAARKFGNQLKARRVQKQAQQQWLPISNTQTKTKRKRKTQSVKPIGAGTSNSYNVVKYKPMKGYKNLRQDTMQDVWRISNRFYFTSLMGSQGAHQLWDWESVAPGSLTTQTRNGILTRQHVNELMAKCVRTRFEINDAFVPETASSIAELWLDRFDCTTLFTNQSPGSVVITIYDCIARKQGSTLPRTDWDQGINMEEGQDVSDPTALGSKPTDSKYFNANWKISKITKIELATGRSHEHTYKFSYHGKLPIATTWNALTAYTNLAGLTHNQMIVMHGMPIDNTNAYAQVGGSEVSIDQTKIVGVSNYNFYTRMRLKKQPKIYGSSVLPTTAQMGAAYIQSENDQSVINSFIATNFG